MTVFFSPHKLREGHALPFKLDLTLQVLEEDEVLQQNVPPEVAVTELQIHQLEMKKRKLLFTKWNLISHPAFKES